MIKNSRFSQYLYFILDSSYLLICAGVVSIFLERRLCMTIHLLKKTTRKLHTTWITFVLFLTNFLVNKQQF